MVKFSEFEELLVEWLWVLYEKKMHVLLMNKVDEMQKEFLKV